jgi:Zn-finger protein
MLAITRKEIGAGQESTKQKLLAMGAGAVLQKRGEFQEFQIVDEVRNTKCMVRGGVIDGHILFREKADKELVELKGSRFYVVGDGELRKKFNAAIVENCGTVPAKSISSQKPETKSKVIGEAETHIHKNYDGTDEEVPANLYCNKFICECGNVRWVKNADMFQVKACKPCVAVARKSKAAERVSDLRKKEKK